VTTAALRLAATVRGSLLYLTVTGVAAVVIVVVLIFILGLIVYGVWRRSPR
jgi:hypothetical protein